jgi:uncharacterized membrane protein YhaH (DUF805 family)
MDNNELKADEKRKDKDRTGNWVGGAVLVGVGLFFLLGNLTDLRFDNWWALFILIPVFGMWGKAWKSYQQAGRLDKDARQEVMGAFFPLFVALIFLFNWNWGQVWPGFIIIAGLNALVGGYFD